jgi:antitoxin component of MazEF toxin-antitoxin module
MEQAIVNADGVLVIPAELLKKLYLAVGTRVTIEETAGSLLIKPVRDRAFFEKLPELIDSSSLPTIDEFLSWKMKDITLEDRLK